MADHDPKMQKASDCIRPQVKCPDVQQEPCEGTVELTGKVYMECCCPRLYSQTFIVNIGPQTEAQLIAFLQNTVTAWESSGYVVLGHSLVDAGAGWVLGLTIAWYA